MRIFTHRAIALPHLFVTDGDTNAHIGRQRSAQFEGIQPKDHYIFGNKIIKTRNYCMGKTENKRHHGNTKNYITGHVQPNTGIIMHTDNVELTNTTPSNSASGITYIRSTNDYSISSHQMFGSIFNSSPRYVQIMNISSMPHGEIDNFIELFEGFYKSFLTEVDRSDISFSDDKSDEDDTYSVYRQVAIALSNNENGGDNILVEILGAPKTTTFTFLSYNKKSVALLTDFLSSHKTTFKTASTKQKDKTFYTISSTSYGFELEDMTISAVAHDNAMVDINYNNNFKDADVIIKNSIDENKKGLILLHGDPGCGKTSYIKHLITRKSKRKIIYIPTHLASAIASPTFISFIKSDLANSVLVIEDAEQVLLTRDSAESAKDAVANILNLTDGILADALNVLIICTFNTDMKFLDKALLRKGRLLLDYKFDLLAADKTDIICQRLYGKTVGKALPLSEIYNLEDSTTVDASATKDRQPKFGFAP